MNSDDKDKIFRFATGVVFVAFIIVILVSYDSAKKEVDGEGILPTISADKSAIKEKPEDEGGMDIPFRETEIYDSVGTDVGDNIAASSVKKEDKSSQEVKFKEPKKKTTSKKQSLKQRNLPLRKKI